MTVATDPIAPTAENTHQTLVTVGVDTHLDSHVAGSLKLGWTPASLLVGRLQAKPRKSGLAKAIQEFGRLQKSLFILRYAEDLDLRKRVNRQLNKGEELGALKDFLFFANDGNIRRRQPEEQADQALCLSLLVDAVITWNTVHYQKALDELRSEGYPVRDEDLAHLSPTRYAHINPYGRYRFDLGAGSGDEPLRLPGTVQRPEQDRHDSRLC